jgi:hypothetical protein
VLQLLKKGLSDCGSLRIRPAATISGAGKHDRDHAGRYTRIDQATTIGRVPTDDCFMTQLAVKRD